MKWSLDPLWVKVHCVYKSFKNLFIIVILWKLFTVNVNVNVAQCVGRRTIDSIHTGWEGVRIKGAFLFKLAFGSVEVKHYFSNLLCNISGIILETLKTLRITTKKIHKTLWSCSLKITFNKQQLIDHYQWPVSESEQPLHQLQSLTRGHVPQASRWSKA